MSPLQRYTWSKAEKLKSRKRIDLVFKQGRSFAVFPFKVFYLLTSADAASGTPGDPAASAGLRPIEASHPIDIPPVSAGPRTERPAERPAVKGATPQKTASIQAGFGAGSRHFKKAVDRNRIKRLSREAWRLQKNALAHQLAAKGVSMAIFFLYIGKDLPDHQTVNGKIGVILQKLLKETA